MIGKIKASGAKLLLAGMLAPTNWGDAYEQRLRRALSRACAGARDDALSVLSRRCRDGAKLNQPDGLHPNERGVAVIVDRIAPYRRRSCSEARHDRAVRRRLRRGRSRHPRRRAVSPAAGSIAGALSASSMSASRPRRPIAAESLARPGGGTGIDAWVGGVGLGVCAAGEEIYERPAAAVLTAALPPDKFPPVRGDRATRAPTCRAATPAGSRALQPSLALVHGDPRCPDLLRAAIDTAAPAAPSWSAAWCRTAVPSRWSAGDAASEARRRSASRHRRADAGAPRSRSPPG